MFLTPLYTVCLPGKKSLTLFFLFWYGGKQQKTDKESLGRDVFVVVVSGFGGGFLLQQRAYEIKVCQRHKRGIFRLVQHSSSRKMYVCVCLYLIYSWMS